MQKCLLTFVSIMIIAGIYSCSSQYPILSQKVATEASQLKEFCKQEELKSETVTKADSLYFISDDLIKKGNHEKSYYLMELAVIYYRLSLCAHDFIVSENTIDTLKNTLSDTQEELKTYQRILTELESKEL